MAAIFSLLDRVRMPYHGCAEVGVEATAGDMMNGPFEMQFRRSGARIVDNAEFLARILQAIALSAPLGFGKGAYYTPYIARVILSN